MLTVKQVENAKPRDKLSDGNGLRLDVDAHGNKSWVLRFTSPSTGKERYMGLGSAKDVSLAEARDLRDEARRLIRQGLDPIEHRNDKRAAAKIERARGISFETFAKQYVASVTAGFKNPKHRQQWSNSLRDHAYPHIGQTPIADVDTEAVLRVLRPIWSELPETARRIRGRLEAILDAARVEGKHAGPNPALWRGNLNKAGLPKHKKSDTKHHPALPYVEMPAFWQSLSADTSDAARMLRFVILTACRFGEAAGISAAEIKDDLWVVPAARMKAYRAHRVPLTRLALDQLPFNRVSDVSIAKCIARHTNKPATCHGFRSTFRDWAGDTTHFARETIEVALAHKIGGKTEQAYLRSDALEKRRELMQAWEKYCLSMTSDCSTTC
jgi:integrase